jgi:phage/plasmid-associated DNA primase
MALIDEIPNNAVLHEAKVKLLTGGAPIPFRQLFCGQSELDSYSKIVFNCNGVPKLESLSKGMMRRLFAIPFDAIFQYAHEPLPTDPEAAKAVFLRIDNFASTFDLKACLYVFVQCAKEYYDHGGLGEVPAEFLAKRQGMIDSSDYVQQFIESDLILVKKDEKAKELASDVFAAYEKFIRFSSVGKLGSKEFREKLEEKGLRVKRYKDKDAPDHLANKYMVFDVKFADKRRF